MSFINPAFIRAAMLVALFSFCSFTAFAQEGEPIVIDEVIAQANDGVITLSQLKREINDNVRSLMEVEKISEADARKKLEEKRGQLIVALIEEILLIQKGKEMGITEEVEAEVNRRLLEIAADQGIKTIEELYKAMTASNVNPEEFKQKYRAQVTREMVLRNDSDAKLYWGLSEKELKDYFAKHPEKFKKPEEVTLSEIFLGFAGRSEEDVMKKAAQIVEEIRKGGDFAKLAATYSERTDQQGNRIAQKTGGKVGTFKVSELVANFVAGVKNVKVGGVSDPIRTDEGVEILRVDDRIAGSETPTYDENAVRLAITQERASQERKKYLDNLKTEAYVKVSEAYRPLVASLLTTPTAPSAATTANKKKDKEKDKDKKPNR